MEVCKMSRYCRKLGDHGEEFAAGMLMDRGYQILERNYRCRSGEIDIIAIRDGIIHFIEVKTRSGSEYGDPAEAVNESKQKRIRKSAECYLLNRRMIWRAVSLDVMEVTANLIEDCI